MSKYTKEEKKEIRAEFRKDPIGFWTKPFIEFWKENPLKAIWTFFSWVFIFYFIFTFLQAVNYDIMYCDSNIDEFDGRILDVYNPFVEFVNERNAIATEQMHEEYPLNTRMNTDTWEVEVISEEEMKNNTRIQQLMKDNDYQIECRYDFKRWIHDDKHIFSNMKKMVINRWFKNTN